MKWLVSSLLAVMVGAAGCGSNEPGGAGGGGGAAPATGCNADPWSCPAGKTCAISNEGKTFACLASGAGKVGDTCKNIIDQPQCGDELACFHVEGHESGVCSPYCDTTVAAHSCLKGTPCVNLQVGSAGVARICSVEGGGGGAGGGASTATGTGGASGSGGAGGK